MATLGTQNISTSYNQVLKTYGSNIVGATLAAVSSGDEAGVSALQISTTGVKSTGTFAVDGAATFGSSITASTGTVTIGTESVNTSTIGTLAVTNTATVGTLKVGAAGPRLTAVSYGTAAFTLSTVQPHNLADTTTGTFGLTGTELGDIVIGSINSLGSTTGTTQIITSFFPIASNVVRYVVNSKGSTAGTVPAGTIYATAMRFTS
jgi:hypothetical protein